jgi:hypothetical protein
MADTITTLTASAIANLAFQEFIKLGMEIISLIEDKLFGKLVIVLFSPDNPEFG